MAFLHGVETIQMQVGETTITGVRSAVIGTVGFAPKGPRNVLTQVVSQQDGAQFGKALPSFDIPVSIEARNANGGGSLLVVNVYDPSINNAHANSEPHDVPANGRVRLDFAPVTAPSIKNQASETLVEGTDYTINDYGDIQFTAQAMNGVTPEAEVRATITIKVLGGVSGDTLDTLEVESPGGMMLDLIAAPLSWSTSDSVTATAWAAGITQNGFTATAASNIITVTAPVGSGDGYNGKVPVFTKTGTVGLTPDAAGFVGGEDAVPGQTATSSIEATYEYFDDTTVTAAQINGTIDISGTRTGFELLKMAYNTFGYRAKLIVCPQSFAFPSVVNKMAEIAAHQKAIYYVDGPPDASISTVISARGPLGTYSGFNSSDQRRTLCYPFIKRYDEYSNQDNWWPLSPFLAAAQAAKDVNDPISYAASVSNTEIKGITGISRLIEFELGDENCEANQLNAAGITTVITGFGLGWRAWGNRNASFPLNAGAETFVCVTRVADILNESVQEASLVFVDKGITPALIDSVIATVEGYMQTLEGFGRLLPGSRCIFDPADNPISQLQNGQVVFRLIYMPPVPAERITFKSYVDVSLLKAALAA